MLHCKTNGKNQHFHYGRYQISTTENVLFTSYHIIFPIDAKIIFLMSEYDKKPLKKIAVCLCLVFIVKAVFKKRGSNY